MKKPGMAMKALKKVKKEPLKKEEGGSLKKEDKLNAANLKKLGELSLKEKITQVAEDHPEDEEAQALVLHQSMTAVEKSNGWNQHQVHLKKKGNESLKKEFDELDKKSKGLSTALFLLKKNKSLFGNVSKSVSQEVSLKKREKWLTQKEVDAKWSESELEAHLASGRLIWKSAGHNVWEYQDTQDIERVVAGKRSLLYQTGQEYELEEGDEEDWCKTLDKDLHNILLGGLEKGTGKGSSKSLEKGTGKGKTPKGRSQPKPLKDEEEEEPMDLKEALKKAKKTRDLLTNTSSNFEEALKKVEKSPYLSKQSFKDKQNVLDGLQEMVKKTKKLLEKGEKNRVEVLKEHILEACACMKEAKEEAKELVQISFKAASKAASSSSKAKKWSLKKDISPGKP